MFKKTIILIVSIILIGSVGIAYSGETTKLEGGQVAELNELQRILSEPLPKEGEIAVSLPEIDQIWKDLVAVTGFKAVFLYKSDLKVNAYIMKDKNKNNIVVINLGLLKVLKTKDEIAGVLAHEMTHGMHDHLSKIKNNATGTIVLAAVLGELLNRKVGAGVGSLITGVGASLAVNGYSREQEVEADDGGVEFAVKAGYSPYGLYNAITNMALAGLVTEPSGFNSHPPTERRLMHILNKSNEWCDRLGSKGTPPKITFVPEPDIEATPEPVVANETDNTPFVAMEHKSDGVDVVATYPVSNQVKDILIKLHNEGATLFKGGKYADATQKFTEAVGCYKNNYLATFWLAKTAQKMKDKEKMQKWFDRTIQINPEYEPAMQFKFLYIK